MYTTFFSAAAYLEEKQMERNIGVSFSKGTVSVTSEGSKKYKLEEACSVLDNVKCTSKYWKKAKMEINVGHSIGLYSELCGYEVG